LLLLLAALAVDGNPGRVDFDGADLDFADGAVVAAERQRRGPVGWSRRRKRASANVVKPECSFWTVFCLANLANFEVVEN
jgi:hypothetical protein